MTWSIEVTNEDEFVSCEVSKWLWCVGFYEGYGVLTKCEYAANGTVELPPLEAQFALIQLNKFRFDLKICGNGVQGWAATVAFESGNDAKREDCEEDHRNHMAVECEVHEGHCPDVSSLVAVTAGGAQKCKVPRTHGRRILASHGDVVVGVERECHLELPSSL